jgi:hypothetical protein
MDWVREGTRQRSRILYVFRTPGGVRVGRVALQPEVLRQIQAQYPELIFDWKAVLDTRQVIDAAPEPRRQARRRPEEEGPAVVADPEQAESTQPSLASQGGTSRPAIPSVVDGATPDERVAFLAHWYPVARDRVVRATSDPVRREALVALAERLNPATWTAPDDITTGLLQASEALERHSRVLTRRRRRSGRGRPARDSATPNSVRPTGEGGGSEEARAPVVPIPDEVPPSGE